MHVKSAKSDGAEKNMNSLCDVDVILGLDEHTSFVWVCACID